MNRQTDWYRDLEQDDEYWAESTKIDFAVALEHLMRRIGINKTELSRKLKTSPAYITKVLRGDNNLTIESMTKLARAMGGRLRIEIVNEKENVQRWPITIFEQKQNAANQPSPPALAATVVNMSQYREERDKLRDAA